MEGLSSSAAAQDARNVRAALAPQSLPQPFDSEAMKDFARLRQAHINLFAAHMRLETAFPKLEPPDKDFDKRTFCEHFPAAFREAEHEVARLTQSLGEVSQMMASISRRAASSSEQQPYYDANERPSSGAAPTGPQHAIRRSSTTVSTFSSPQQSQQQSVAYTSSALRGDSGSAIATVTQGRRGSYAAAVATSYSTTAQPGNVNDRIISNNSVPQSQGMSQGQTIGRDGFGPHSKLAASQQGQDRAGSSVFLPQQQAHVLAPPASGPRGRRA